MVLNMATMERIRRMVARRAWMRGVHVVLLLTLVLGAIPKWELHVHADDGVGHHHAFVDHAQNRDNVASPDGDGSGDLGALHVHDLATLTVFAVSTEPLSFFPVPTGQWVCCKPALELPFSAWPPPHRPPIA